MINPMYYLEEFLDHIEEETSRLPRPWAYLLIFVVAGLLWIPVGMAMLKLNEWLPLLYRWWLS